jgi:hypothetical protein
VIFHQDYSEKLGHFVVFLKGALTLRFGPSCTTRARSAGKSGSKILVQKGQREEIVYINEAYVHAPLVRSLRIARRWRPTVNSENY